MRSLDQHLEHCALLEDEERCKEYSKEFGVNRRSVVLDLQHFNPCDGSLLPDVMHDVLEGALQYEAKLLLKYCIRDKIFFKLKALNEAIERADMGYMEVASRPAPITKNALQSDDNLLKQKGTKFMQFAV